MLLVVGKIIRAHGVHGEVVVDVRTDEPAQRYVVGSALTTDSTAVRRPAAAEGAWQIPSTLTIEAIRPHQGRFLITFEGVYDRALAEELRGVLLCVDSADVADPDDPDEFHDYRLIGLAAVTPVGEPLGEITGVDHAPASDLLVLRRPDGATALVPFVKVFVPEVDLAAGRIVMTPPEGLFDL